MKTTNDEAIRLTAMRIAALFMGVDCTGQKPTPTQAWDSYGTHVRMPLEAMLKELAFEVGI